MSKQTFGNLVTYKGKYLAKAKEKALNGNLVFAQITEGDDKGYYIYAGGAEGHLVDLDTFKSLKSDVTSISQELERQGLLLDMPFGEGDKKMTIVEYVESEITKLSLGNASKLDVATAIGASGAATNDKLATEKAVRDAINAIPSVDVPVKDVQLNGTSVIGAGGVASLTADATVTKDSTNLVTSGAVEKAIVEAVGSVGDVMNFLGVTTVDLASAAYKSNNEIPILNAEGSEVSTTAAKGDIAVAINMADGETAINKEYIWSGEVWIEIGHVYEDEAGVITIGGKAGAIKLGSGLQISEDKTLNVSSTLLQSIEAAISNVQGDTATFTEVVEGQSDKTRVVKNTLAVREDAAQGVTGKSGLVTDTYLKEYVEDVLAWEVLSDEA